MIEDWRDVPGHPGFSASTLGRVRGPSGRIVGSPDRDGYLRVERRVDGRRAVVAAHSLVALAYIGPRPAGDDIDHIDRNRTNNAPHNLRYCPHAENMKGVVGYRAVGEAHFSSVLTEALVREILATERPGRTPHGATPPNSIKGMAARYGVTRAAICGVLSGRTWSHLSPGLHQPDREPAGGAE